MLHAVLRHAEALTTRRQRTRTVVIEQRTSSCALQSRQHGNLPPHHVPSARQKLPTVHCWGLDPHPVPVAVQKDGEIALFGGEFFDSDTDRQLVYGDLFVFNCSKERWRKVVVPHRRALQTSSS